MRESTFRQSMTWLHTWFGLVLCWIMYFIFVTGTVGYFDTEIDRWMKPAEPVSDIISLEKTLAIADKYLRENASGANRWIIVPVKKRGNDNILVNWQTPNTEDSPSRFERRKINAQTGQLVDEAIRPTGGGQTLYKMHYRLHYLDRDITYYFIGIVTLIMFIGLLTGVVVHRKIFKDFFTFRSHKRARSWLDMHNLMSVSTLPFQLMISYSGLIFMVTSFLPIIALGGYGFDIDKTQSELSAIAGGSAVERAGELSPLVSLEKIGAQLDKTLSSDQLRNIQIVMPGDKNAVINAYFTEGISTRNSKKNQFDATTGEFLNSEQIATNSALIFSTAMLGLHEGLFAGPILRWLYFVAGVLGSGMIATGAIYWVRKRQLKNTVPVHKGLNLVNNLNIGTIVGLLSAMAAYFLANRLLPANIENRAEWEIHAMYLVWFACLLHPFFRKDKYKAWIEQCYFAGMLYCAVPITNALTTDLHLFYTVSNNQWVLASFDFTVLATGIIFIIVAIILQRQSTTVAIVAKDNLDLDKGRNA